MKNHLINFICYFLISAAPLFSQGQNQDKYYAAASPLMMFRGGAGDRAEGKAENQLPIGADPRNRTAVNNSSSAVLRGTVFSREEGTLPSPPPQRGEMPTQGELNRRMIDAAKTRVGFDAARELHQEKVAAGKRYDDSVSAEVLLAQAPQQAAVRTKEAQQQLEIKRQVHQSRVRNYVWSDRDFAAWELPGEIPEVFLPPGDPDIVVPPEMLHEEAEVLGRRLLAEARQMANLHEKEAEENSTPLPGAVTVEESPLDVEEEIKNEIIAEGLNPSDENRTLIEQRLAARARANELHKQAATLAKESRRLREAQAAASEKPSASDESSSIISSVKSGIFGAFSKANTVTGAWRSVVMPADFEMAARLASEAEQGWETLALEAEKIRLGKETILSRDQKPILSLWEKADQELLALNKKENAAQTLQENWQANVTRWQWRVKVEKAVQRLRRAEENLATAQENKWIIQDRYFQGKVTDAKKEEASESMMMAEEEVDAASIAVNQTEKAWRVVALQHESVRNYSDDVEREIALKKLRRADQAVIDVWFKLTDVDETNLQKETTLEAAQVRIKQEGDRYELKRKTDLARYFGATSKVGLVLADAKRIYRQGNKAAAQALYDGANECEITACHDYMETVKQDALESARERLPELAAFWTRRMSTAQAEQQARATAARFKKSSSDPWADEAQQAVQHATAIATAEEVGFNIYQEEERRLNDIETLFIAIIAAKKTALRERPRKAAAAYFAKDPTSWSNLSTDEREHYNQEIRNTNDDAEEPFKEKLQTAEERHTKAQGKAKKLIFDLGGAGVKALEAAGAELGSVREMMRVRNEAISLALRPIEERGEMLKEIHYGISKEAFQKEAASLRSKAERISGQDLEASIDSAAVQTTIFSAPVTEMHRQREAIAAWEKYIKLCQRGYRLVPKKHEDFFWWTSELERAEKLKNIQSSRMVDREARELERNADLATSHAMEAIDEDVMHSLWSKALEARRKAVDKWTQIHDAYVKRQADALGDLKQEWNRFIKAAREAKIAQEALVFLHEAQCSSSKASMALKKAQALSLKDDACEEAWASVEHLTNLAKAACERAIAHYQRVESSFVGTNPSRWKKDFEAVKRENDFCKVAPYWNKMIKRGLMAQTALGEAWPLKVEQSLFVAIDLAWDETLPKAQELWITAEEKMRRADEATEAALKVAEDDPMFTSLWDAALRINQEAEEGWEKMISYGSEIKIPEKYSFFRGKLKMEAAYRQSFCVARQAWQKMRQEAATASAARERALLREPGEPVFDFSSLKALILKEDQLRKNVLGQDPNTDYWGEHLRFKSVSSAEWEKKGKKWTSAELEESQNISDQLRSALPATEYHDWDRHQNPDYYNRAIRRVSWFFVNTRYGDGEAYMNPELATSIAEKFKALLPEKHHEQWESDLDVIKYEKAFQKLSGCWKEAVSTGNDAIAGRSLFRDDSIHSAQYAAGKYKEAFLKAEQLRETIPEKKKADWDYYYLHQAQYWAAFFRAKPFQSEASKAHEAASEIFHKSYNMDPEALSCEVAWEEAVRACHAAEVAYHKAADLYRNLRAVSPANRQITVDEHFDQAWYYKIYYQARPSWYEADRAVQVMKALKKKALSLNPQHVDFEKIWNEVLEQCPLIEQAYDRVTQAYESLLKELPAQKWEYGQGHWKKDMGTLVYWKVYYQLHPLWCHAEKSEQVTRARENQGAKEVAAAWEAVIQKIKELNQMLPERESLNSYLRQAETQKNYWDTFSL